MSTSRLVPIALSLLLSSAALACDSGPEAPPEDADTPASPGRADDPHGGQDLATCDVAGLRSVSRPYDRDGGEFVYHYQHLQRGEGDGPTVIFVPGGPGIGSIGTELALPADTDLVLTDPRGVGCNAADAPHAPDFYGTEIFAEDIVAIVEDLQLRDYVIYGHSYGTVLSTVVTAKLEEEGLPLPRTLVLEGILGEAMGSDDAAYRQLWPQVRDRLPASVREQLASDPLPLGYDRGAWGEFIATMLSQRSPKMLEGLLLGLDEGSDPTELRAWLDALGGGPPMWEDPVMMGLFESVACREIAENSWFAWELVGGEIVPTIDVCADVDLQTPWDAGHWPVTVPIVYVQGGADPATVIDNARTHFERQDGTDRTFITLPTVGHTPLSWALPLACGDAVWDAILGGGDVEAAVLGCGVGASVEVARAGG